ncbi:MAG: HypC/HybG/HupF family hydrogenase formation chaperone [Deferribacteraceae bacterium]|jgi:hydrogenase expression/formation protein HypC|nr:HypC/HybG/HupF family hydrogenase formation chaperone [Deferribacteraceae bacterium]
MCVGIPSEIESCDEVSAIVKLGGTRREISMLFMDNPEDVKPGDWVLVHAGYAMCRIDPEYAVETLNAMLSLAEGKVPQIDIKLQRLS